jgi:hypothetical protein
MAVDVPLRRAWNVGSIAQHCAMPMQFSFPGSRRPVKAGHDFASCGFTSGTSQLLAGLAINYGPFTGRTDEASLDIIGGGGVATSGIQTFAIWSPSAVSVTPPPVPEPATFALICTGLIAWVVPLGRRARSIARAQ